MKYMNFPTSWFISWGKFTLLNSQAAHYTFNICKHERAIDLYPEHHQFDQELLRKRRLLTIGNFPRIYQNLLNQHTDISNTFQDVVFYNWRLHTCSRNCLQYSTCAIFNYSGQYKLFTDLKKKKKKSILHTNITPLCQTRYQSYFCCSIANPYFLVSLYPHLLSIWYITQNLYKRLGNHEVKISQQISIKVSNVM